MARHHCFSNQALAVPEHGRTGPARTPQWTAVVREALGGIDGFSLTPEMTMLIAAQASLLVPGLSFEHFRKVSAIIVHPTTVVLTGPRGSSVSGLMTDAPMPILGQAAERGPIIIAWDAALHDARNPERGHNVMSASSPTNSTCWTTWLTARLRCSATSGTMGGGVHPGVRGSAGRQGQRVGRLRRSQSRGVLCRCDRKLLRHPGATPDHKPDLYEVLSGFYNQDPAARVERSAYQRRMT